MKVTFRADSSLQIGTGHLVRCLSLAETLAELGAEIQFVCRDLEGNVSRLVTDRGFTLKLLAPDSDDAQATVQAMAMGAPTDWLVVDHYGLDARWEHALRNSTRKILAIDDLALRSHDCDVLLDQNFFLQGQTRYQGLVARSCKLLLGPRYALLAKSFRQLKAPKARAGKIQKLLIFFGGADAGNETSKALEALLLLNCPGLEIDVVVGFSNPHLAAVRALAARMPEVQCQAQVHVQIDYMLRLMSAADLAIGAGGTATWERCRTGLPCITIAIADNQIEPSESLAKAGHIIYLGESADVTAQALAENIQQLVHNPTKLHGYSKSCLALVDGQGTRRIAQLLTVPEITIRAAQAADCDQIHEWRNAQVTRQHSFDSREVPLEDHRKWYSATLQNPNRVLLVGNMAGKPVGVLRYDFEKDVATVSVYLVPGNSGKGLGSTLLDAGSSWIRNNRPEIRVLLAEIKPDNVQSIGTFLSAGFGATQISERVHIFELLL